MSKNGPTATRGSAPSRRWQRVRAFGRRVWAIVRRGVELFPLTPLGIAVLAAAALALLRYGIGRVDLILLVVGGVAIAVGALGLLSVIAASIGLGLALRKAKGGDALTLECGYASRTGFSLSTLWFVPFVKIRWAWSSPAAEVSLVKRARRLHEEVTGHRRGIHEEVERRVDVGDAFGLAKISLRVREPRTVRLVPSVGRLKNMAVVRSLATGEDLPFPGGQPEGERADLRRYVPGDPVRFILWKVFAKSRQLVVRTPEQAISPARQTFAYLVADEADEAAAGTARVAVETGALGQTWTLGADGTPEIAKGKTHAMEIIARSASCPEDLRGGGLSSFLSKHVTRGSRLVVFVPGRPGPWVERVAAAARTRSRGTGQASEIEFIVCTDGVDRTRPASLLRRLATSKPRPDPAAPPRPVPIAEVRAVTTGLAAARASVLLVDRQNGHVWGEAHQRALTAA